MRISIPVDFSYPPTSPYFLGAFAKLRKATISFVMYVHLSVCQSVRIEQFGSSWTNLVKFFVCAFFENLSRKCNFHCNLTRITGTLHGDLYTLLIISRLVLLRMRNISNKCCRENQNTHFMFNNSFSKIVAFMR